ncbi:DUF29 domain-containing protein [Acidisphaera sp. S103]|uniref:DUF29 domain-containing protein n=1 Tax=Acidisphaera sp. S103 TaxID=1747223 RepID=UPI0020B16B36|nr:DUF29 domain-containing protein [Acidisphaera sp. S103]
MDEPGMANRPLYDQDFYAWANEQAGLLRAGKLSEADIGHIAEEIESLGKGEKRELVSRLRGLLVHLLKWRFQPAFRSTGWRLTIEEQRNQLADHLADNPSLKSSLNETIVSAYRNAVLSAARETGLDRTAFPVTHHWSPEQIMDSTFYPEATH